MLTRTSNSGAASPEANELLGLEHPRKHVNPHHPSKSVEAYYDARAPEYDDWYSGAGLYAERDRPGWEAELGALETVVSSLAPVRTLDVACGTGFLTRHLRGDVVALDQSTRMLDVARRQAPHATLVQGDALELPFPDGAFDRVFTGHFYGHLYEPERTRFVAEARRVAHELVVVDTARGCSDVDERMSPRTLNDGSEWEVYKRYLRGETLAAELGGGEILHEGTWFVVVRSPA